LCMRRRIFPAPPSSVPRTAARFRIMGGRTLTSFQPVAHQACLHGDFELRLVAGT
jgi:hypothetical protein